MGISRHFIFIIVVTVSGVSADHARAAGESPPGANDWDDPSALRLRQAFCGEGADSSEGTTQCLLQFEYVSGHEIGVSNADDPSIRPFSFPRALRGEVGLPELVWGDQDGSSGRVVRRRVVQPKGIDLESQVFFWGSRSEGFFQLYVLGMKGMDALRANRRGTGNDLHLDVYDPRIVHLDREDGDGAWSTGVRVRIVRNEAWMFGQPIVPGAVSRSFNPNSEREEFSPTLMRLSEAKLNALETEIRQQRVPLFPMPRGRVFGEFYEVSDPRNVGVGKTETRYVYMDRMRSDRFDSPTGGQTLRVFYGPLRRMHEKKIVDQTLTGQGGMRLVFGSGEILVRTGELHALVTSWFPYNPSKNVHGADQKLTLVRWGPDMRPFYRALLTQEGFGFSDELAQSQWVTPGDLFFPARTRSFWAYARDVVKRLRFKRADCNRSVEGLQ